MSQSVRSIPRRATSRTPAARTLARAPYPLDVVYAQAGIPAPATREVAPGRIPPPKVGDIVEILPLV